MIKGASVLFIAVSMLSSALAADHDDCNIIITNGLKESHVSNTNISFLKNVFEKFCYKDGRYNSSNSNTQLGVIMDYIPISFKTAGADTSQIMTDFCHDFRLSEDYNKTVDQYDEHIVQRAYDSYDACVRISKDGFYVTHDIVNDSKAQIFLQAAVGRPIEVLGLDGTTNIRCVGPGGDGSEIKYGIATGTKSDKAINILCTRDNRKDADGNIVYDEGAVDIAIASDKYNFVWPKSVTLPDNTASHVEAQFVDVKSQLATLEDRMNDVVAFSYSGSQKVPDNQTVNIEIQTRNFNINADVGVKNGDWTWTVKQSGMYIMSLSASLDGTHDYPFHALGYKSCIIIARRNGVIAATVAGTTADFSCDATGPLSLSTGDEVTAMVGQSVYAPADNFRTTISGLMVSK